MIAIIDYDAGNVGSVKNALDSLGVQSQLTKDIAVVQSASGIIFPGVGAAKEGMKNIKKYGLEPIIKKQIKNGTPFLGICLGMQLLFECSEEGNTQCLDVLDGTVKQFKISQKVPHIGWNQVQLPPHALFANIPNNSFFYFVHSYYCQPEQKNLVTASTEYEISFCSAVCDNNLWAVQFHPEKSGAIGLQLLRNFITYTYDNNPSN